eukprot:11073630-Alexandrium_andersonii.AAC.1
MVGPCVLIGCVAYHADGGGVNSVAAGSGPNRKNDGPQPVGVGPPVDDRVGQAWQDFTVSSRCRPIPQTSPREELVQRVPDDPDPSKRESTTKALPANCRGGGVGNSTASLGRA